MIRTTALLGWIAAAVVPAAGYAQTVPAILAPDGVVPSASRAEDRGRAIGCMATAIAYEAGYEPVEGRQAVAEVILNRLRHSAFPKSVCGVVFAGSERRTGCQFSFACDGSLNRRMSATVMATAQMIATAAIDGQNPVRAPGATHYHADYVSPYWAPSLIRVAKIGAHIFYRGAGGRDQGMGALAYAPFNEPAVAPLAAISSPAALGKLSVLPKAVPSLPRPFAPWGLAPPAPTEPSG